MLGQLLTTTHSNPHHLLFVDLQRQEESASLSAKNLKQDLFLTSSVLPQSDTHTHTQPRSRNVYRVSINLAIKTLRSLRVVRFSHFAPCDFLDSPSFIKPI